MLIVVLKPGWFWCINCTYIIYILNVCKKKLSVQNKSVSAYYFLSIHKSSTDTALQKTFLLFLVIVLLVKITDSLLLLLYTNDKPFLSKWIGFRYFKSLSYLLWNGCASVIAKGHFCMGCSVMFAVCRIRSNLFLLVWIKNNSKIYLIWP